MSEASTDYLTWSAFLWLSNKQEVFEVVTGIVLSFSSDDDAAYALKEYIEDERPADEVGLYHDLLNWALNHIDYHRLAESIRAHADDYLASH